MSDISMTPTRPYFVRAVYDWILDNNCTPYIAVNALLPGVQVPLEHVIDGKIILNLETTAIADLNMTNEAIEFSARFAGVARVIYIPMVAVLGVYAKENGQGMAFTIEEYEHEDSDEPEPPKPSRSTGRPSLKVVK